MMVNVNPDVLAATGNAVSSDASKIAEQLENVKKSVDNLSGWQSAKKDELTTKLMADLKAMQEMAGAISSYGATATSVANGVAEIEKKIGESLNG